MKFEDLLDFWHSATHKGSIENPTHSAENRNRNCGDKVKFDFIIEDDLVKDCKYTGVGCVLCIGTASYLADRAIGQTVSDCKEFDLDADFEITPMRKKCVALSVSTFRHALNEKTQDTSS